MLTPFQKRRFRWYRGIAIVVAIIGILGLIAGSIDAAGTGNFTGAGSVWILIISLWQANRLDKILKKDAE